MRELMADFAQWSPLCWHVCGGCVALFGIAWVWLRREAKRAQHFQTTPANLGSKTRLYDEEVTR